ncbi:proprotein convertase P-domain-containing protein [Catelliglobosispora koreensis]|uniref:proprotein convertase P-domain-containing protein n=1 Tax=Catelliglobosispora koreensis TaxID=129052 RepID=UPI0003777AA3|nr:proprotein convertase P-domain-containing protein [Catelliglobosispora koreensis]
MRSLNALLAAMLVSFGSVSVTSQPEAPAAAPQPQATRVGEEKLLSLRLQGDTDKQVVHEPSATYVKVHFSVFDLAPGAYVTVSNPAGTEVHTYHGIRTKGDADRTLHGRQGWAAMSIDGDTAIVTRHGKGTVQIDSYWRGYTQAEVVANNPGLFSVCGTDARRDVVCYQSSHPTEFTRSNAVAKLLIGGGGACTTWRVGNTNRMLTNKHCFSTQSQVQSSEMQFNYQCATCGGNNPGAGTKVSGSTLLKVSTGGSGELDYTLYSVNNFAAIQGFGTLFLETRAPVNGERIYIPGHGDATPKRLSIYEDMQGGGLCTVRNAAINSWNMSYSCDTSGGNSGSPVLSAAHKVIALHHLGGCPNNQGARMHLIYNEIKDLIDNGGTTPPGPRFENANNVTIADLSTVESSVTVSGVAGNAPATLKVDVDIKHTYIGDLVVSLIAPDGSAYVLHNRTGGSADNLITNYTVNASSEVANGVWKLRVQDAASADVGYIDLWALTF